MDNIINNITLIVREFNILSVIDIIIVAFVLYRLVLLIKGTRAVQLIKGLVVLLVATAVSNWLNLNTLYWLLSQAWLALVVALPIVFQPELRRALEKLGGGKFFNPLTQMTDIDRTRLVDEVIRAAGAMAVNRVGALIVLERNTGLEEFIDTGTRLDAMVSAELLVNIFVPKTPLHDGAVIIRGDRVAAAACVLPLSPSPYIDRNLGTRHRAGLGITEESDALALIVSEETGAITLAGEGILTRNMDEAALRDRLIKALQQEKPQNKLNNLWHRR
ncbi:MAG: diadenylate cyclase CdaA [Bacillota bacterium]